MKNVLVTGGAGFIGSNFVPMLLARDPALRVIVLDVLTYAGHRPNLDESSGRITFIQGNIGDKGLVTDILASDDVDTVVHFAAESHVDRSILGPEIFVETNITGTFRLLEACRQVWLHPSRRPGDRRRFHHVSTDEVYGSLGPEDPPFLESTPYDPTSPYSASKAAADHLVRAYGRTFGIETTISNCSNNYGPFQYPEKLIPLMILNARDGKPLPIYGDGRQRRDWLYVDDHCEGILQILEHGKPGHTYNIGGDGEKENIDIVRLICQKLDTLQPLPDGSPHESLMRFVKDRPGHDRRYAICSRKLTEETGWRPAYSLAAGIEKTVDWYLSNGAWLEAVTAKGLASWMKVHYGPIG